MARAAPLSRMALAGAALGLAAACAREDEGTMRARLAQWFALGETVAFSAHSECAAGVFALRGDAIAAALPVADSAGEMLRALDRRGRAALDDPGQAPDAGLVALVNADRATGQAMRRAALEARVCMDEDIRAGFRAGLTAPGAMLAYDAESGTVMVVDRAAGRLFALMGAS